MLRRLLLVGVTTGALASAGVATAHGTAHSAGVTPFKSSSVYCIAYNLAKADAFVGCTARIGGRWTTVLLSRQGAPLTAPAPSAPKNPAVFQQLSGRWHGGPFTCDPTYGGVACVAASGHGFGINSHRIVKG